MLLTALVVQSTAVQGTAAYKVPLYKVPLCKVRMDQVPLYKVPLYIISVSHLVMFTPPPPIQKVKNVYVSKLKSGDTAPVNSVKLVRNADSGWRISR